MGYDEEPAYVLAAAATFIALGTIVVGLRLYTRTVQKVKIGPDDWLILPGLLMVIGCAICLMIGVKNKSFGYPTPPPPDPLDPLDSTTYITTLQNKLQFSIFLMQIAAMGFIKLSTIFFYRRLFVTGKPGSAFNILTWILVIIVSAWALGFFSLFLFNCRSHVDAHWATTRIHRKECPNNIPQDQSLAGTDFATDALVLGLPIPIVLRLHMNVKRKVSILAVFALGFLALAASIIRLAMFVQVTKLDATRAKELDINLLSTRGLYWSFLEAGLALVACNLPSLHALISRTSLASAIRSIRGQLYLRSTHVSSGVSNSHGSKIQNGTNYAAFDVAILAERSNSAHIETYALGDATLILHDNQDASKPAIWVDTSIVQLNDHV